MPLMVFYMNLLDIVKNDPFSSNYILPPGKTPKDLVRLMLAEQQRVFGETILKEFSQVVLVRNMKLLTKKYCIDDAKRGIMTAIRMAEHPFSTAFVEEQIVWRLDSQCSTQVILTNLKIQSIQNKS